MKVELYLIAHLGTRMDVEAQIVVGEFGRLLLQLPGKGNLPAERTRAEKMLYRHMGHAMKPDCPVSLTLLALSSKS